MKKSLEKEVILGLSKCIPDVSIKEILLDNYVTTFPKIWDEKTEETGTVRENRATNL